MNIGRAGSSILPIAQMVSDPEAGEEVVKQFAREESGDRILHLPWGKTTRRRMRPTTLRDGPIMMVRDGENQNTNIN